MPDHKRASGSRSCRGTAYVLVLACSALIAVVGVAGVLAARVLRTSLHSHTDAAKARVGAQSAIESTLMEAANTIGWRTSAAAGPITTTPPNMQRLSVVASDPVDADLINSIQDPVDLVASAAAGETNQMASLRLTPTQTPMSCMNYGIIANGNIVFDGTQILLRQPVHSNGAISALGGSVIGADVSATGLITGITYQGSIAPLSPSVPVPNSSVVASYAKRGVKINYNSIAGAAIDKVLISPLANPYGASTSASGIYEIDCSNKPLTIKDSRIVGTLVITRCTLLVIEKNISWEPASPELPALVSDSPVEYKFDATDLSESAQNRNFNPPGTPYRGLTNSTQTDRMASVLRGVYFTSGNVNLSGGKPTFEGRLIVGGTLNIKASPVRVRRDIAETPMEGFIDHGPFLITPGTLRRAVN
ncbi:MAG: hypothetical protein HUU18_05370 [Phycisphaerales bacterium]|nr:hypothetical protein [Phycisphaerales bacterium]